MISQTDYLAHDGMGLAALVRKREVRASELLEAAIERARLVDPKLHAIVTPMYELARERAQTPLEGPFAGVPFLIKDLFQDYAGVLAGNGSNAYKRAGWKPSVHSEIVRRWLAAGTVIVGRTNTPEFGAKSITEPDAWPPTRNPWDLARSPGGSSGGSAAAVAAGIVPLAGANDGGGSIRIPAASTGLFGLKPGRGRTPAGPELGEMMHGAAMHHVLSRSVRDSACMLDATHGPELGSWCKIAPPPRPYLEEVAREPGRLRIAFSARSPIGTEVEPEIVRALLDSAKLLEGLGHEVVEAEPAIDGTQLAADFLGMWFSHLASHVARARELTRAVDADFEADTLAVAAMGRALSAPDYIEKYLHWNHYGIRLAEFLGQHDLYMTPTLALRPPRIGSLSTPPWAAQSTRVLSQLGLSGLISLAAAGKVEQISRENLKGVPFTQLANVTGVPAMSVPLQRFEDGLPIGIQFVADHGGEGLLFSLAAQLERAAPWHARKPPDL